MHLPTDEAEDDIPGHEGTGFDFGIWPELFGLAVVIAVMVFMFSLATGNW